jgi:shikimate kinase
VKSNITVGGFMASGKSTVGPIVADKLGFSFFDIDQEIEKDEALLISDIFASKGETYFRILEEQKIRHYLNRKRTVVSLGGGSLHWKCNYQWIERKSMLFILLADWKTISQRLCKGNRPLSSSAAELFQERLFIYQNTGYGIDVLNKSPLEIANQIIVKYYE